MSGSNTCTSLVSVMVEEVFHRPTPYGFCHEVDLKMQNLLSNFNIGWIWREKGSDGANKAPYGVLAPQEIRELKLIFEDSISQEGQYAGPRSLILRTMLMVEPSKTLPQEDQWPQYISEVIAVDLYPVFKAPRVMYRNLQQTRDGLNLDARQVLLDDFLLASTRANSATRHRMECERAIPSLEQQRTPSNSSTSLWAQIMIDLLTVLFAPVIAIYHILDRVTKGQTASHSAMPVYTPSPAAAGQRFPIIISEDNHSTACCTPVAADPDPPGRRSRQE